MKVFLVAIMNESTKKIEEKIDNEINKTVKSISEYKN